MPQDSDPVPGTGVPPLREPGRTPGYYLGKLVKHLRAGTLDRRIARSLRDRRWARRDRWWDRQSRNAAFFDAEVEEGVLLRLYFDNVIDRDIYCHDHEVDERKFLRMFLRPGDTFIDVGANLGLYSILASRIAGPTGAVFAFEPDPKTYDRLLHNLHANGCINVRPFRIALSNVDESRIMQMSSSGFDAYNSFGTPVRGDGSFEPVEIDCVSLDSFADRQSGLDAITMIKVDVEGWETMVLHGAERHLSREDAPVLQVEFNDQAAKAVGQPCADLYRWLDRLGYSIHSFDARRNALIPHPFAEHYVYDNVYAVKRMDFVLDRLNGGRH